MPEFIFKGNNVKYILHTYCARFQHEYLPIYNKYYADSIFIQYIPPTRSSALFFPGHFPRLQFENTQLNRLIFNNFSALSSALSTVIARSWERSINLIWLSISVLAIFLLDPTRAEAAPPPSGPFKELPIGWLFNFYLPPSRAMGHGAEAGRRREELAIDSSVGCRWLSLTNEATWTTTATVRGRQMWSRR